MKPIFLLVLISLPVFGFSQVTHPYTSVVDTAAVVREVDSLIQVFHALTGKRDFEKALEVNAAAEKLALEKLGRESAAYGKCCHNYGVVFQYKGDHAESEKWYLEAIAIREKMLGKEHPDFAASLNNLANLYNRMGNYEKAEPLYLEAKTIREKTLGKEHPDYSASLNNLASLYKAMSRYAEAEPLYLESKAIREKALGKEHPNYASSLNNLAGLYLAMGRYVEAEPLYLESKAIREKTLGKEHLDYAWSLNNLAVLYKAMGRYDEAEPLYLETKVIREKKLGKEHLNYASSLDNLASLYLDMGHYEAAESLYLEAKAIKEKILSNEHPDYAHTLHNLALLYNDMGRYKTAESLYLNSKFILEKTLGREHPDCATSWNSLANLYMQMGRYESAEQLLLDAKTVKEKALGKEHPTYASTLNNLARLHQILGRYEAAEIIYLEAKAIWGKEPGKEHPDFPIALQNLAGLYTDTRRYEAAQQLFEQARVIRGKNLGEEHPDYAKILHDLAVLYFKQEDYTSATQLIQEAIGIWEKVFGKKHSIYASGLSSLASVYGEMGCYKDAEMLTLESMAIREKTLGKEHPNYALDLNNLADLNSRMGHYDSAELFYIESTAAQRNIIFKSSQHLSERELSSYANLFVKYIDGYFSFTQMKNRGLPGFSATSFDNALFHKGFLLTAANRLKHLALSDSVTANRHELWLSYHRRLAKETAKPIAERDSAHVAEWEENANTLEKDLARSVAGFGEALRQVTWQDVQAKLPPGSAAIEFIHYRYYTPKPTDSTFYSALMVRPGDTAPHFVTLFEERQIAKLLEGVSSESDLKIKALYTFQEKGQALYDLIWKPLEHLLQSVDKVYCSPSGLLHRLNLGAVPLDARRTFAERHGLVLVGSTRRLTETETENRVSKEAALFGGIRYDTTGLTAVENADTSGFSTSSLRGGSFYHGDSDVAAWGYLEYSGREVADIQKSLAKAGYQPRLFSGYEATEESLKNLGQKNPSPAILHIATHGFFYPDPKIDVRNERMRSEMSVPVFKLSDNPMMRAGLILAGANHVWQGSASLPGREDGILTAYEISQMNLTNTELVVLSACETGLGQIEGNEGVYGLQRAFKIAGAKYLLMSLWKVNDSSTQELMTEFYRQWLERGLPIPEAFRAAQAKMKAKYEDPYHWAGFVLVK